MKCLRFHKVKMGWDENANDARWLCNVEKQARSDETNRVVTLQNPSIPPPLCFSTFHTVIWNRMNLLRLLCVH